jgi:hypothetical protein
MQAAAGNNNKTRVVLIYGLILRDGHWAVTCFKSIYYFLSKTHIRDEYFIKKIK